MLICWWVRRSSTCCWLKVIISCRELILASVFPFESKLRTSLITSTGFNSDMLGIILPNPHKNLRSSRLFTSFLKNIFLILLGICIINSFRTSSALGYSEVTLRLKVSTHYPTRVFRISTMLFLFPPSKLYSL